MMVSYGNASGPLDPVDVPKEIQSKSLFLTRPTIGHYFTNRQELQKLTGGLTVPQIIINNKCIGGFDNLLMLDQTGKLEELL